MLKLYTGLKRMTIYWKGIARQPLINRSVTREFTVLEEAFSGKSRYDLYHKRKRNKIDPFHEATRGYIFAENEASCRVMRE